MRPLLVLLGAGLVSWGLRVTFAAAVPPARLPATLRRALEHVGPAATAAVLATTLAHGQGALTVVIPSPTLGGVLVAGLVAWRTRSMALTVPAGIAAVAGLQLL